MGSPASSLRRLQEESNHREMNRKFLPVRLNVFLNALAAWKSPLWIKE
jgi:hypothetical protein